MLISRETISDALRYWERGRVLFNIVLLAFVLYQFGGILPALPMTLWLELIAAAGVANVVYCAAYPVDLLIQASDYRHLGRTVGRPLLWAGGTLLSVVMAHLTLAALLKGVIKGT